MAGEILIATQTFSTTIDGEEFTVHAGRTRVRAGHPLIAANPGYFRAIDAHYDIEQATAAPGEKRGRRHRTTEAV